MKGMNSKATPREQDPFVTRHMGRLVALWAETLPRAGSIAEMRHAQSGTQDAQATEAAKIAGEKERGDGKNLTHFTLKPRLDNGAIIEASANFLHHGELRPIAHALYDQHVAFTTARAAELGVVLEPVVRTHKSPGSHRAHYKEFASLRVRLPDDAQAETMQQLFTDMTRQQSKAVVTNLVGLPSDGTGSFTTDLLVNPYDHSRLLNNQVAAEAIALRIKLYGHEKEPLEKFAEAHGITQAVKALGRGGSRELGA